MSNQKKVLIFIIGFVLTGLLIATFFPKEAKRNKDAVIRIGAGDDVSGLLMQEITDLLNGKYEISKTMETSSFQDC